jgi:hypothetical protein
MVDWILWNRRRYGAYPPLCDGFLARFGFMPPGAGRARAASRRTRVRVRQIPRRRRKRVACAPRSRGLARIAATEINRQPRPLIEAAGLRLCARESVGLGGLFIAARAEKPP